MLFETEKQKGFISSMRTDIEYYQLHFSISTLMVENMPISKIIVIMEKVFKGISTIKDHKNLPQYLKLLRNCIETLIFLISDKILPFRFADEQENSLTPDFYKIIETCFKIIDENDKIYKQNSYIIISNQIVVQPNQPNIHPLISSNDYTMPSSQIFYRGISQSSISNDGQHMEEEKKGEGQIPQPQTHANNQNYTINKMIFYEDDDFNINIEDIDLKIQLWSKLISSTLNLMQILMTHKSINTVVISVL